jgi:hypothetical protein
MALDALGAVSEILSDYMNGLGQWGANVSPVEQVSNISYPYLTWFWSGGGSELQAVHLRSARLQMSVKGVCGEEDGIVSPYNTALVMQGEIADLLVDSGLQDVDPRLPSHTDWMVLTVTQGRVIYQRVQLSDGSWSHHAGHVYEFMMEKV